MIIYQTKISCKIEEGEGLLHAYISKHPANIVLLTAGEHFLLNFAHICPTIGYPY